MSVPVRLSDKRKKGRTVKRERLVEKMPDIKREKNWS
jgi:hypothetical protein